VVGIFEDTRPINVIFASNEGQGKELTKIKLRNACAFRTTASVTYKDLTVACGYLNNGKGRLPKKEVYEGRPDDFVPGGFLATKDGNAGQAWNIGAKYKYNKWEFSTVYHSMQRKIAKSEKVKGHALTLAIDYLVCSGLKIFGEFDYVTSKSCDTACRMYNLTHDSRKAIKRQDTGVFILGAQVTF
jgi:predicted porin